MSVEKFKQIIALQVELNEKKEPNWISKNLDWQTAILDECAEAIGSTNWKWWKNAVTADGTPIPDDIANLKVEAIDLLHFMISNYLANGYGNDKLGEPIIVTEKMIYGAADYFNRACKTNSNFKKPEPFTVIIKRILRHTLNNELQSSITSLFSLFGALGMDSSQIYAAYLSKNILNHYRQDRGYKNAENNYRKEINGIEDNVQLKTIVDGLSSQGYGYDALKSAVYHAMDQWQSA